MAPDELDRGNVDAIRDVVIRPRAGRLFVDPAVTATAA
jgi:hypothetical protein